MGFSVSSFIYEEIRDYFSAKVKASNEVKLVVA